MLKGIIALHVQMSRGLQILSLSLSTFYDVLRNSQNELGNHLKPNNRIPDIHLVI